MAATYWLVWSVDDREPFRSRKYPGMWCRNYNGVPKPIDPKKKMPFSYVTWTRSTYSSSVWTYDRNHAERFYTLRAARLMRKLLHERYGAGAPITKYAISRVTTRPVLHKTDPAGDP